MRPDSFNLAEYVLTSALADPEKTALSVLCPTKGTDNWSFARLVSAVRGTATGLLAQGLRPGDFVLLRLGNTPQFPIAYLGAIAAGLVPVPTAAMLTAGEVAGIIDTLRPAAILQDPDVPCPPSDRIIGRDALQAMQQLPAAAWHRSDPDRLGYIIYTSGTSGKPSAVMHAHRAILARRFMFDGWYGLRPTDRLLHAGAFNWTYTLGTGLMDPWTIGATALIPAPGTSAQDLPVLLRQHHASIFAAAPGVYRQMLPDDGPLDLPDLRHGLSAGEKLPASVLDRWTSATGTPIYEAYGMSECSTFISGCPAHPARAGTLGQPQGGRRITIRGETGETAVDAVGTIAVHKSDPGLMLGYYGDPEGTKKRYHGDWFMTGDQGARDQDGQIAYLGRADDMMNAGGFRVSPLEVEAALSRMPGITTVGVTQVEVKPDVWVIAAFYTGPAALEDTALHGFASESLARYKQPRLYMHLTSLPTGANGKLQRRALRAIYKETR